MSRIKRKAERALLAAGGVLCVILAAWPVISNVHHSIHAHVLLNSYQEEVSDLSSDDLKTEWEACRRYNEDLYLRRRHGQDECLRTQEPKTPAYTQRDTDGQEEAAANTAESDDSLRRAAYEQRLSLDEKGIMAYVIIPAISVSLPVYHYTDEESMSSGAGHMYETSLPVGGPSSHAAISAHTGSTRQALFTDLDRLKLGDRFQIQVLDETHVYEVDRILTVLPHETEYLEIEEGMDQVTLITCTPFGINSHRLLVRGSRCASDMQDTAAGGVEGAERNEGPGGVEGAERNTGAEQDENSDRDEGIGGDEAAEDTADGSNSVAAGGVRADGQGSTWLAHYVRALLIGLAAGAAVMLVMRHSGRRRRR